jgi:hypothetical protein
MKLKADNDGLNSISFALGCEYDTFYTKNKNTTDSRFIAYRHNGSKGIVSTWIIYSFQNTLAVKGKKE